jgi:16S rRNA (cytidine1402-2'-O)-methyltransferase
MTLYLIPNLLADLPDHASFLPASIDAAMAQIEGLIAESEGGGRRFLKRFKTKKPPHQMPIALLSEPADFLLEPVLKGESWAVVSDAGLPCLADPGALLVFKAKQKGIAVEAFSGPSSVTHALMLSGLPAQRFSFCGYLPKDPKGRQQQLAAMQKRSKEERSVQIFIEAPYRNQHCFEDCLKILADSTYLAVGYNLTAPDQLMKTQTVQNWKKAPAELEKKPAIFLLYAGMWPC